MYGHISLCVYVHLWPKWAQNKSFHFCVHVLYWGRCSKNRKTKFSSQYIHWHEKWSVVNRAALLFSHLSIKMPETQSWLLQIHWCGCEWGFILYPQFTAICCFDHGVITDTEKQRFSEQQSKRERERSTSAGTQMLKIVKKSHNAKKWSHFRSWNQRKFGFFALKDWLIIKIVTLLNSVNPQIH